MPRKRPQDLVADLSPLPDLPEALVFARGHRRPLPPDELPPEMSLTGLPVLHGVLETIAQRTLDRAWSAIFSQLAQRVEAVEIRAARVTTTEKALESALRRTTHLEGTLATAKLELKERERLAEGLRARIRSIECERDDAAQEVADWAADVKLLAEQENELRLRWLWVLQDGHEQMGHGRGAVRTCSATWCRRASLVLAEIPSVLQQAQAELLSEWTDPEQGTRLE